MSDTINFLKDLGANDYLEDLSLVKYTNLSLIRNTDLVTSKNVNYTSNNDSTTPAFNSSNNTNFATGKAKQLIDIALSYSGIPYNFGADPNNTSSFDCSSFTKHCYGQIGINLPRTAEEQSKIGADPGSNLQPGDLVFWQGTYKSGVSHVGIFMYGDKFIAASSSKGISTNSLNNSYYKQHYFGARRVL